MATNLEKLYFKLRSKLIEDREVNFYEDTRTETETFISKEKCLGCFEVINGTPNLIVAIGGDKTTAYSTFLHEYCHFLQWKEDTDCWKGEYLTKEEHKRFKKFFKKLDKVECNATLDYWKLGKYELSQEEVKSYTDRTVAVERDCEERVINLMKDHRVSKKFIDDYTQKANMYLIKYLYQRKHRMWKDTEKAYKKMPKILITLDELNEINPEYETLILKNIQKEEG